MNSSLILLLGLFFCVFSAQATNTVTIPSCGCDSGSNNRLLDITLQLDSLTVSVPFDIDVNVRLHADVGIVFAGTVLASFNGNIGGELVHVSIDIKDTVSLHSDIVVEITLGTVHVNGDVNLVLNTVDKLLGNLVNGVFTKVTGVLATLLSNLLNSFDCTVDIVNVEILADGKVDVSLQISKAIQAGLSLTLDVLAINVDGVTVVVDSKLVVFVGTRGEIVHVVLDIASKIDLFINAQVTLEVCLSNIQLSADVDININVRGLNLCLDRLLDLISISGGVVGHTVATPDVEVSDCQLINPNTLLVSVRLNVDVPSTLSVTAHVELFSELDGSLLSVDVQVNLHGRAGEVVTVNVDISQVTLTADVYVSVKLLNLHINLGDIVVDLHLQPLQLFHYVNGVLTRVLDSLLGSDVEVCLLNILNVRVENGRILVDLQLDGNAAGGLTIDLNANVLSVLGIQVSVSVVPVHFQGVSGEIQTAALINIPLIGSLTLNLSLSNLHIDADIFVDTSAVHACRLSSIL